MKLTNEVAILMLKNTNVNGENVYEFEDDGDNKNAYRLAVDKLEESTKRLDTIEKAFELLASDYYNSKGKFLFKSKRSVMDRYINLAKGEL